MREQEQNQEQVQEQECEHLYEGFTSKTTHEVFKYYIQPVMLTIVVTVIYVAVYVVGWKLFWSVVGSESKENLYVEEISERGVIGFAGIIIFLCAMAWLPEYFRVINSFFLPCDYQEFPFPDDNP